MTTDLTLRLVRALCLAAGLSAAAVAQATPLESLTWPELRDRIAAGSTTVLVPIGGTEQNGPHMVLGKHNVRVRVLADRIAAQLGDAIVAPVLAYVPEGSIDPPSAHMRWPGTISIAEPTFEALLVDAARSLHRHGFRVIVLLGDHGGYQRNLERVANRLNRQWRDGTQVLALTEYYRAARVPGHADRADTSLALAADPTLVRAARIADPGVPAGNSGVTGDPRGASAEEGRAGLDRIVEASAAAIRQHMKEGAKQ
jgi:creatinine amidohydrolase/Fe(II)-dependent formamide hydrolase-like protein